MITLESRLREHPFTSTMSQEHLEILHEHASLVRFAPNQTIFREGQPANRFYLILSGKVALEIFLLNPGPIALQAIEKGDVLGWSWLVPPYTWKFDARASEQTEAILVEADALRKLIEASDNLANALLKRFAQVLDERLQAAKHQLLDSYTIRV